METKARLHDISFDEHGKQRVTFTLDRRAEMGDLRDKDIRLKASVWREKRSLNSNAYFHVLVGKIAEKTAQSRTEVHNQLISDYGQLEMDGSRVMNIIMDADINWRKLEGMHLRPTSARRMMDNGRMYQVYLVMRGSHTYDSKDMSVLIAGTISEAQELGIETATPEEQERMLQLWEQYNQKNTRAS